ncbi:MAG: recombinase family protein [Acidimicrobiales bacterium]
MTVVAHLSDEGLSGKRADNRPALAEALDQLAAGTADVLVVANERARRLAIERLAAPSGITDSD